MAQIWPFLKGELNSWNATKMGQNCRMRSIIGSRVYKQDSQRYSLFLSRSKDIFRNKLGIDWVRPERLSMTSEDFVYSQFSVIVHCSHIVHFITLTCTSSTYPDYKYDSELMLPESAMWLTLTQTLPLISMQSGWGFWESEILLLAWKMLLNIFTISPNCANSVVYHDFQPFLIAAYNKKCILSPNLVDLHNIHSNAHKNLKQVSWNYAYSYYVLIYFIKLHLSLLCIQFILFFKKNQPASWPTKSISWFTTLLWLKHSRTASWNTFCASN